MEKRVLLAVVLSFVVLYGYQALFPPPEPQTPARTPGAARQEARPQKPAESTAPTPTAPSQPVAVEARSQPVLAGTREQNIVVENGPVRAVFTTRGAALESWRLRNYSDPGGQPLDLVPTAVPDAVKPFTLATEDAELSAVLRQALFKPSVEALTVGGQPATLGFEYRDANGLVVRKEFSFSSDQPYVIGFMAHAERAGTSIPTTVRWGPALGTGVVGGGMNYNPPAQPIFYRDREITRVGISDIAEYRAVEGMTGFAGVDDHYFLAAVLPEQPVHIEYAPVQVPVEGADKGLQFIDWSVRYPSPPKDVRFFFGPKDFDVLASVNRDLVRAIDFGMFSWLVVPLLRALKWVNGYIGNYGWSIIALTVLINLVMFPLRHKSVVSMRRMQELQPEVKAIQERYAKLKMSDPARSKMNAELMNLYRERGVNPASGCVPMLLTFPVLLAFYSMLVVAIELRGAPFIGWIKDLSAHDPYFVTPVLMGISQFVQTKMSPSTADPMQQKMMLFMPIMFTAMLMWAPSGLVLYWTASNVWAIGQQAVTNRLIGQSPRHTVRPPAERRLKSAGGGKSPQAAKERK